MDNPAIFVDFMYAVVVGTALPRLQDERVLAWNSPLAWGLLFLIAVFLEDFYLYHVQVVPYLKQFPQWRTFIIAMLIIGSWFLCQAAFPSKPVLFLFSFLVFFFLKLAGGISMKNSRYPTRKDFLFLAPMIAALMLILSRNFPFFAEHPGHLLWVLAPVWFLAVLTWWLLNGSGSTAKTLQHETT